MCANGHSNPSRSTSQNCFVNMNWKEILLESHVALVATGGFVEAFGSACSTAIISNHYFDFLLLFVLIVIVYGAVIIHVSCSQVLSLKLRARTNGRGLPVPLQISNPNQPIPTLG